MRPEASPVPRRSRRRASPATVAGWIAETEAEEARYEVGLRQIAKASERMTEQEIKSIVDKLADIARVLADANADKSEIFRRLGLKLTYHPGRRLVEARITTAEYDSLLDSCRQAFLNSVDNSSDMLLSTLV